MNVLEIKIKNYQCKHKYHKFVSVHVFFCMDWLVSLAISLQNVFYTQEYVQKSVRHHHTLNILIIKKPSGENFFFKVGPNKWAAHFKIHCVYKPFKFACKQWQLAQCVPSCHLYVNAEQDTWIRRCRKWMGKVPYLITLNTLFVSALPLCSLSGIRLCGSQPPLPSRQVVN